MQQVKLGKTEPVPVREVWPHEALNFTKWLAEEENLAQLGDACSIDLELVDTESAVGSFAVDIFAKETGSDRRVVIENQLEDTNHDHLGKIITYRTTGVWAYSIWFYLADILMVSIDMVLYYRNTRLDRKAEA